MEHVGPTHVIEIVQSGFDGISFMSETLVLVSDEYAMLGHTPKDPYSLKIYIDGLHATYGIDFILDGRKIQFTPPLAGNEVVVADYCTSGNVASPIPKSIDFDIPTQNVRVNALGVLQVLVSNGDDPETFSWYDMVTNVHPITGSITYDVSETPSLTQ